MNISTDQVFTVSKDVLFQEVAGETVLLDLNSESYFGLDEVGTRIWTLLNEGRTACPLGYCPDDCPSVSRAVSTNR